MTWLCSSRRGWTVKVHSFRPFFMFAPLINHKYSKGESSPAKRPMMVARTAKTRGTVTMNASFKKSVRKRTLELELSPTNSTDVLSSACCLLKAITFITSP